MDKRRPRFVPGGSFSQECLERREVLSAIGAAHAARAAVTKTSLVVNPGTLGQPITFSATVQGPVSAGSPTGTVEIVDHGSVLGTIALVPTISTNSKYAYSEATAVMTQPPGSAAYFFGKHQVTAVFIPSGSYAKSRGRATFNVATPSYTTLPDGVKVVSITQGSGPAIQSGQTAGVLYTGYLAKTGQVFDDSARGGTAPFDFALGSGQVISGFDAGVTGMQVGETRIILVPPADGYGPKATGPIPKNSTLVFEVTLTSIS
jgi:hypothetical protein